MTNTLTARALVGAADLRAAVGWLTRAVAPHDVASFGVPAGTIGWSCWQTLEHVVDDLLAYALQLAALPRLGYVPLVGSNGSADVVRVDPTGGTPGMVEALTAAGELLATQVQSAAPGARAFHPAGLTDASGFAAMGAVELLVHGHDVLAGIDAPEAPFPDGVAARALERLFPEIDPLVLGARDADQALLWATGRGELPTRPRRARWQWDVTVRG